MFANLSIDILWLTHRWQPHFYLLASESGRVDFSNLAIPAITFHQEMKAELEHNCTVNILGMIARAPCMKGVNTVSLVVREPSGPPDSSALVLRDISKVPLRRKQILEVLKHEVCLYPQGRRIHKKCPVLHWGQVAATITSILLNRLKRDVAFFEAGKLGSDGEKSPVLSISPIILTLGSSSEYDMVSCHP